MINKLNNKIYPEQYLLLAFISILTFKVVMLAQYLVATAGRHGYLTMAIMIPIEIMLMTITYGIIKKGSLFELDIPKWIKGTFAVLILFSSVLKCSFLGSEGVSYISTSIYDNVRWSYITLALMTVCAYLAHKGGKVIARTAQIFFWLMALSFAFHIIFSNTNLEIINLMPFTPTADVAVAGDKYLIWFGDYTPMLFFSIVKSPNQKGKKLALWTIATICATLLCSVGMMIVFICIFGESGAIVGNAFLNVSALNKIAFMIGSVDLLTVCVWIIMCVIKLSLLLFACTECLKFFFGNKWWASVICATVVYLIIVHGIGNLKNCYIIATSFLRYIVFAIEFGLIIMCYIALRIADKKQKPDSQSSIATSQKSAN